MKKQSQARYKFVFNRKNKNLDDGSTAPLELEIYFGRTERKYLTTKVLLKADQWGTSGRYKDMVKSSHKNYIAFNQYLQGLVADIQKVEYSMINNGRVFNKKVLEDYLANKQVAIDFISFLEEEALKDSTVTYGPRKEWNYTIHIFKEFCGETGCEFSDFNYDKIINFDIFLKERKLARNTVHKHHKNLARFVNVAIKKKLLKAEDNPYNDFTSKKVAGNRHNLTLEEVARIEAIDFPPIGTEQVSYVRDLFLFATYTGMRYSDVIGLTYANVQESEEGYTLRFVQQKVEHTKTIEVVLPLYLLFNGKPNELLKRYISIPNPSKSIFPDITNQVVNRHLKSIAVMARINSVLSFHVGRHTFGTALADITGNPYLIMQLMGHSEIKTSMIYIHQSEERLRKQLRTINW
jgi:site-specific recombinase XerD